MSENIMVDPHRPPPSPQEVWEEIVKLAEEWPDFRYTNQPLRVAAQDRNPEGLKDLSCGYVGFAQGKREGEGCIVGQALVRRGVNPEWLLELETESEGESSLAAPAILYRIIGEKSLGRVTEGIGFVQSHQDGGRTRREAVEMARQYVQVIRPFRPDHRGEGEMTRDHYFVKGGSEGHCASWRSATPALQNTGWSLSTECGWPAAEHPMPTLGQAVFMNATVVKMHTSEGRTEYHEAPLPTDAGTGEQVTEGIITGWRTVTEGITVTETEIDFFGSYSNSGKQFVADPNGSRRVWLVAFDLRRKPVMCFDDHLRLVEP